MQRWFSCLGLACGAASILAGSVAAQEIQIQVQVQQGNAIQIQAQPAQVQIQPGGKMVARPPIMMAQQTRLTEADAIFVGRVVAIEPMDIEAAQTPGGANVKYRVAVVQVSDAIYGVKKGQETVRVAFIAQGGNVAPGVGVGGGGAAGGVQILPAIQPAIQPLPPNGGPGGLRRPFPGFNQVNLTVGQDGMFAVSKHHKENFFLSPTFNNFITREGNQAFEGEVKNAKQLAKVMGNPAAGLKADDAHERYLAAVVLVGKYRSISNPTGAATKQEQIDADESKLILKAIAGGDWKNINQFNANIPNPYQLFSELGVTQKDGYNPVNLRTQPEIAQAMQKWLDENSDKYRINKLVVDPTAKAPAVQPGVQPGQPGVIQPGVIIRPGVRPLPAPLPPVPANPAPNRDK